MAHDEAIYIKGARVHNLRNIEVTIPHNKLVSELWVLWFSVIWKKDVFFQLEDRQVHKEEQFQSVEDQDAGVAETTGLMGAVVKE